MWKSKGVKKTKKMSIEKAYMSRRRPRQAGRTKGSYLGRCCGSAPTHRSRREYMRPAHFPFKVTSGAIGATELSAEPSLQISSFTCRLGRRNKTRFVERSRSISWSTYALPCHRS